MKRIIISIICLSTLLIASEKIITWECKFPTYSKDDGLHTAKKFDLTFRLDTISNKAYMEGNNGLSDVVSIYNEIDKAITFVEVTGIKNVMTTTITQKGMAVHSRNTVIVGELVPTQYYGSCNFK